LSYNNKDQELDLLNVGTSTFLNVPKARDSSDAAGNRALRFWAKYTF
jgi:hypothetical protein